MTGGIGVRKARLAMATSHRLAVLRNMVTSLIKLERIHTTLPKAMALKRVADKIVTKGKQDTVQARRTAHGYVREKEMVWKLFDILGPRYAHRPGGYTRVIRTTFRRGDHAPMAYIEFVDRPGELRPATKCDEAYGAAKDAQLEANLQEFEAWKTARSERMKTWKVEKVK